MKVGFAAAALLSAGLSFPSGAIAGPPGSYEHDLASLSLAKMRPHERLWKIFQIHWDHAMEDNPEWASLVGHPGEDDRLTDMSLAAIERRKKEPAMALQALSGVSRKQLSAADQESYDLFKYNLQIQQEGTAFPDELLAISPLSGIQQDLAGLLDLMPKGSVADYEHRIARLKAAPARIAQVIDLLREGVKRGVTPPRITLRDIPDQIQAQAEPDPLKNPLLASFQDFPKSIQAADQQRLRAEASEVVQSAVAPAFQQLWDYFTREYIPNSRQTTAWEDLPDGKAWYAFAVKRETTTHLTPDQIHEVGLKEVARIRAQMEQVIDSVGFQGGFAKFGEFLITDPQFFFTDPAQLLSAYRDVTKRIDPELPRLFGKLPRLTYGVRPIPHYSEKSQTGAYYENGSPEAGRAGTFFVNTYALNTRPKWEMEVLATHESVPGHHLQLSLSAEMDDMPEFRKNGSYTAFVEGWGLYAESLGEEMGLYTNPYSKFGQLNYEMWRAIRLVVDTGMHHKGWSRDQAIAYFKANNIGKPEHDIVVEVDRYIVWAGQALAYKSGELRIKALRAQAQAELGAKFDLRQFHDAVLDHGTVPLDLLDANVRRWIRLAKAAR